MCIYWHRSSLVLRRVNPSNVQKARLSTVETAFGADGQKRCVTLRIVRMPFAQKDDYCPKESAAKP